MTKATIQTATVMLWGTPVGVFHLDESKGFVTFEYTKEMLASGIEVSPLMMPLSRRIYQFPNLANTSFKGVPGLMADSLPDKFGNAVIDQWLAASGRVSSDFNVVERLCYTGKRGMGALEYEPSNSDPKDLDAQIHMARMADFASAILTEKKELLIASESDLDYKQLLRLGTSAGGARAKAVIAHNPKTGEIRSGQIELGEGFEYWLVKFDGVSKNGDHNLEDVPEYTRIEYVYYQMALLAGITMETCKLHQEGGRYHFMTKRFDRVNNSKRHMQSLGALLHIDYDIPGLCSYEMAALAGKQLGLPAIDIEEFYRRMVFNVLAVNQDDHVKNISFLMDRRGQWTLSPAYDITFAKNLENRWLKAHQMSVNGKLTGILTEDLLAAGKKMDLKPAKCKRIVADVVAALNEFEPLARSCGLREATIRLILKELRP